MERRRVRLYSHPMSFFLRRKSFERALRAPAGDDETDVVAGSERDSLSGSPRPRPVPFVRAVAAAPSFAGGRGAAGPHLAPADAGLAAFGRASRARQCISTCICLNHTRLPRPEHTRTRRTSSVGRQGAGGGADAGLGRSLHFSSPRFQPLKPPTMPTAAPMPNSHSPIRLSKERGPPACLGESRQSRTRDSTRDKQSGRTHTQSGGAHTHSQPFPRATHFPMPSRVVPRYPKIERTRPSQKLSKLSTLKHSQGSRTVVGGARPRHTMALQGGGRGRGRGGE